MNCCMVPAAVCHRMIGVQTSFESGTFACCAATAARAFATAPSSAAKRALVSRAPAAAALTSSLKLFSFPIAASSCSCRLSTCLKKRRDLSLYTYTSSAREHGHARLHRVSYLGFVGLLKLRTRRCSARGTAQAFHFCRHLSFRRCQIRNTSLCRLLLSPTYSTMTT